MGEAPCSAPIRTSGIGIIDSRLSEQTDLAADIRDKLLALHDVLYGTRLLVSEDVPCGPKGGAIDEIDDRLRRNNSSLYDSAREIQLLIDKLVQN